MSFESSINVVQITCYVVLFGYLGIWVFAWGYGAYWDWQQKKKNKK